MDQPKDTSCIYCGGSDRLTNDHVPPRGFFLSPRPADLITVPACQRCNASFQMDDEWLRPAMVLPALEHSPIADTLWDTKVFPAIQRKPRLRQRLIAATRYLGPQSATGLYLAPAPAMPFDRRRLDRAVMRIVRGLAWHEYRWIMPHDLGFSVATGPTRDDLTRRLAAELLGGAGPLVRIADGAFEYLHSRTVDDPDGSAWFLRFYGVVNFLVLTDRRLLSE